jgi:hypothetical protein
MYLEKRTLYSTNKQLHMGKPMLCGILFGRWFIAKVTLVEGEKTTNYSCSVLSATDIFTNVLASSYTKTYCKTGDMVKWLLNISCYSDRPNYVVSEQSIVLENPKVAVDVERVVDEVLTHLDKKGMCGGNFLLYGTPGSGKSTVVELVAQRIGAIVVDYDMSKPGLPIVSMQHQFATDMTPLIIRWNEVDVAIENMSVVTKKNFEGQYHSYVQINDKRDMNDTADYVNKQSNLMVFMTSNKHPSHFDKSLFRDKRVYKIGLGDLNSHALKDI